MAAVIAVGAVSGIGDGDGASGGLLAGLDARAPQGPAPIDITVHEGTSMSVAVSPDGRTLAIDLQGSLWTVPATGGTATRITDVFSDARQPSWSPDGRTIAFFAYRDGGYSLWRIAADGSGLRQLTAGPFDDREPVWSHDGSRIAFSSDRGNPLGSDYNIWTLDVASGELRQLTRDPAEDYMPSWSPDDREISFASTRDNRRSVWAVSTSGGGERKVITTEGTTDAPSWAPSGDIVYHLAGTGSSRLESGGRSLTGSENAFPFRVSWTSPKEFFYVSDGLIRRRSLDGGGSSTIPFSATLQVTRAEYPRRKRDFDSTTPRPVLGIVRPVISPDGTNVAFAAIGDIYVMPVGGKPDNITKDVALDTDPAWSPDGSQLVYSSDKDSGFLQLWVYDVKTRQRRQVTQLTTQPQGASWSPDGSRIAFFAVDAMWRRAEISVLTLATGKVTRIHAPLSGPGNTTWSPDGKRIAVALEAPYSTRYREGSIQVLTMAADAVVPDEAPAAGGEDTATAAPGDKWYAPIPTLSIDSRAGAGPVWSPDGTQMAAVYEGMLSVWPVTPAGEPLGPPRRVTSELAHAPSWVGDSRHLLYQSFDKLKTVDISTGETRDVPVSLTYTPDVPRGRIIVHASTLVDMKGPAARTDVDIIIEGNRIRSVVPHAASRHSGGRVVDATGLTVMPGLVEFHSHLGKDFGASQGRAWLSFGITTVRDPGNTPYEIVEDRESNEAGVRPGPRVFGTGFMMEGSRLYYKMAVSISSPAHLELELQRAKVLQHDFLKSYVRLPDLLQKRVVEFGHGIGIPVATHEIYPASLVGVDNTEHTAATSRRGYSPKVATLQQSYEDVVQLFGKSGRIFCPMISGAGAQKLFTDNPALKTDPRFRLYPQWMQRQVAAQPNSGRGGGGGPTGGQGKMVMETMQAGALIVAGTDTPNGLNLHGEILGYTMAGMTPYEALRAATVNPAQALNLDTGTIEAGKLADLIFVDGNPLVDISATHKVKRVIANGKVFELADLIGAR